MLPAVTPLERGRRLEQTIAAYFSSHGYAVQTNQVLAGRSGGRHEIDVLAEMTDALTSVRVAVECKAWNAPIEKDVVSKLHYVMSDLGIHKGVIVSLAGARSGAATAAAELGIDVWGPDELRHHLGESVFTDVTQAAAPARGSGRRALGWAFRTDPDAAHQLIRREGKGRLRLRTVENTTWFAAVWVPAYLVSLTVAQPQTRRLRQSLTSIVMVNLYDALAGEFTARVLTPAREVELGNLIAVKPLRRESQIQPLLRKAVEGRQKVTSVAAIQRHDAHLRALGLPLPCHSLTVDNASLVYVPVYAGLLQAGGQDRLVAVSGHTGVIDIALSRVLTSHLAHVRASYGTSGS